MQKKISILLINGPLPPPYGGVSTYLAHALPYLASKGFDVHTIMDKRPDDEKNYDLFRSTGIHIYYGGGPRWLKILRIFRHIPLWFKLARKSNLPLPLLLKTIASQISWIDTAEEILQKHPIDIIHSYDYPWIQGFVASTLARKYGIKCVQTTFGEAVPHEQELVQHDALGEQYIKLVKSVLHDFDMIVAMSKHCARELQTVGIPEERVRVTYYGIDLKKYSPKNEGKTVREKLGIGSHPLVLFLGHIRPRKGPQVLLESIPIFIKNVPDAIVAFVGPDFGMIKSMQQRAQELGVENNVLFLPSQPDDIVVSLFAACDIFAFPTCTPIECLGLSMVQAMASGKPVVGSKINGIPEVIVDNETGFLVEANNARELGEKILTLLQNPALRHQMGQKGRRRVEEKFDQNKLVVELESIYRELAGLKTKI